MLQSGAVLIFLRPLADLQIDYSTKDAQLIAVQNFVNRSADSDYGRKSVQAISRPNAHCTDHTPSSPSEEGSEYE